MAVVGFHIRRAIRAGSLDMLLLEAGRGHMRLVHGSPFLRSGLVTNAARSTAVCDVIVDDGVIVHDRRIHIRVADYGRVHAHHCGVISEIVAAPFAAHKSDAHVAEAVIYAAIISDMATPITIMEEVVTASPAPIRRCPQCTLIGRGDPGARDPIVAVFAIRPITRGPHQSRLRAKRLFVNGKNRRCKSNADYYSRK
jgi:hypothetical protein